MKKIYFLFFVFLAFWRTDAQTLNQSAGWPNPAWTVTGSYNAGATTFEGDPTTSANFAYDDDDAGSGHEDNIAAESPAIDLTAAYNAGETGILVTVDYGYNYLANDVLRFEYWDADAATWNAWGGSLTGNSTTVYDFFCTIPKTSYSTPILAIGAFTATQLSGFKYRIYYNDSLTGSDWNWGFCFDSPTITSISCIPPTGLAANVTSSTTADLSWLAGGSETAWDIELVDITGGGTVTGTPTYTAVTNPFSLSSLASQNNYAFYVRSNCGAGGTSSWSAAFTFNTTQLPGCAGNIEPLDGAIDVVPGAVTFSWDAPTTGDPATSYDLYYGLTPGNATILVGNYTTTTASINITGFSTTFYWKIVPKNAGGSATGCAEWSFTTGAAPGYCLNAPNGQWPTAAYTPATCDGLTTNSITTVGYAGEYSVVNVTSGETYTFQSSIATDLITISEDAGATAVAYGTTPVTWVADITGPVRFYTHIDDNCGDNTASRTRSVICGLPAPDLPDYANLQWPPSATISQGGSVTIYGQVYEAGLTDVTAGQSPGINAWIGYSTTNTNPSTWTTWTPATFNLEVGNNDEYMLDLGATLAPGTYYYATRFNLNGGAYVYGGIDSSNNGNFWDGTTYNSGVLTVTPPPAPNNDECDAAIPLTTGTIFGDYITDGTNVGATTSAQTAPTTCFGFSGGDVWYTAVVPASGNITVETGDSTTGGTGVDTVVTIYTGDCTNLVQVGCDDDGGTGAYSLKSLTGLTPGATLYLRVYEYGNNNAGEFGVSVYDGTLGTNSFDSNNFSYYPNPVKDILNLSYNQAISGVEIFNLLGQKVSAAKYNANQAQVDMSNLANGAYMVKVTSNGQVKTIKVMKQ